MLTLYKLLIRSFLTYAAPIWSSTFSSNYQRIQFTQSNFFRVIGNHLRLTPISRQHYTLNIEPIRFIIYRLNPNCLLTAPHPNPLVKRIVNYTVAELTHRKKNYQDKRPLGICCYNYLTGSNIVYFFSIFTSLIHIDININLCFTRAVVQIFIQIG
jgi:hypothetical protein